MDCRGLSKYVPLTSSCNCFLSLQLSGYIYQDHQKHKSNQNEQKEANSSSSNHSNEAHCCWVICTIISWWKNSAILTSRPKIWGIYHHNFFLKTHSRSYIDNQQQHPVVKRGVANQEVKSVQTYLAESSIAARIGETFIDLYTAVVLCKSSLTCAHKCQMEILNIVVYSYIYNSSVLKWYRSSYSYK